MGIFCLAIPGLILLGILIVVFQVGLRAFQHSSGYHGEYAHTLRLLGLSLCEPLINTFLVIGLNYGIQMLSSRNQ